MDRQKQNDFSLAMEQEVSNQKLPAGLPFANHNCLCPRLNLASPDLDVNLKKEQFLFLNY